MRFIHKSIAALAAYLTFVGAPVQAEVKKLDSNGFLVSHMAEVEVSPDEIWKRLIRPTSWWDEMHSWSGSAEGFTLNPAAGGCFCEQIRENGKARGTVEHMRVMYADPGKVLRMQGALGPLQSEAVLGTLTIAMEPVKGRSGVTRISFNYIVGGYMRFTTKEMAPAVDGVIGEQFAALLAPFDRASAMMGDTPPVSDDSPNETEKKKGEWSLDLNDLSPLDAEELPSPDVTPKPPVAKPPAPKTPAVKPKPRSPSSKNTEPR